MSAETALTAILVRLGGTCRTRPRHTRAQQHRCGAVVDAPARALRGRCAPKRRDTLANGERRPIKDVREGDMVLATDPETGETGAREVVATLPHTDQLLTLRLSSGDVATTEDHRYWNATDREWQESQHLDEGDRLLTADGDEVTVEGLDWTTLHTAAAYDLDIAGIDTYYVGAGKDEVLVHNCNWGNPSTLQRHFRDHGADFAASSADDYARMADDFFVDAQRRGLPTKIDSDGVIRVYDPSTNTFGAYNPDGTTRTFFKPTSSTYWDRQPGVEPWTG